MAKERVEIEVEVDADSATRSLKRLNRSMDESERATRGVSKAQKMAGRSAGMAANEVTEMALGFGTLSPKLREATMGFAMFGNSAVTLGGALGPVGVAIAAVASGLPMLVKELIPAERALKSVDDVIKDLTRDANEAERALGNMLGRIDTFMAQNAAAQRAINIAAGRGTVEEQRARVQSLEQELAIAQDMAGASERIADVGGLTLFMTEGAAGDELTRIQRLQERIIEAREDLATAEETAARRRVGEGGGGGERERGERRPTFDEQAEFDNALNNMPSRLREQRRGDEEIELFRERAAGATAMAVGPTKQEEMLENMRLQQEAQDELNAALQRQAEYQDMVNERLEEAAEIGREAGEVLIMAFEEGPLRALDSFLEATAKRNTILALEEVARAAASYPDFVGIEQHLQAAALHAAVAAAAGGGAAAIDTSGASARPSAADGGGGQAGQAGGSTIVVNYNSPVAEAQIGRQQERARREADRLFGSVAA